MPIFEYLCRECGHQLDALQKIGEPALTVCPACQKSSLDKVVSTPAFHLSGSGWRSPSAATRKAESQARRPRRLAHMLDSGPPHSHDDDGPARSGESHAHNHGGHTHSHSHSHGHSHDHGRKHDH
ncbi:zinc ribbon domain-containing protein [Steroidobacter sp.]|uniref:FmdB family zinc ribbon protein n=1 Tax=Steroidobacter sp. TaxID=1978227 RepID=UPI0032C249CA